MFIFTGVSAENFWLHEWKKHGTCAEELLSLNSESKYFAQALKWFQQYNIKNLLSKVNIMPDVQYNFTEFYECLRNELKIKPEITCFKNEGTHEQYPFEIRICFNKKLEAIDCIYMPSVANSNISKKYSARIPTNCNVKRPILYPSRFPTEKNE